MLFLSVIVVILLLTLQIVRSATYTHSTEQFWRHTQTSASVVEDKIQNRANLLLRAAENLAKNFSIKQLIVDAKADPESLLVAMENQQQRLKADIFFVLDGQQKLLSSSTGQPLARAAGEFSLRGATWLSHGNKVYLLKGAPVKFVERSRSVDAWVLFGYDIAQLINEELMQLTGMQVSLFQPSMQNQILGSSLASARQHQLQQSDIILGNELQYVQLGGQRFIYVTKAYGSMNAMPVYILLATNKDKAYLSYNSLLVQLVGLLVAAALLALLAAWLLSRGVTKPLSRLVTATNKIRQGEYATTLPETSTVEVNALSHAIRDMQHGIQQREKQINHLAYFDELTGLPNRNQFSDHLQQTIDKASDKVMVLMLDIDRFKEINDTLGHDMGDHLLKLIAKRLTSFNERPAFFARLGGDEFAVVVEQCAMQTPDCIAECIARMFEQPFSIDGLILDVDSSIGVSVFPEHASTTQGLLQCADIALYSCKGKHYDFAVYRDELNKHSLQRLNLMSELKEALNDGQLQLYYQPKLSISENRIASVECLIRWIHPTHGFIPPDEFIPLAEQTGAIRDVTKWALRTAMAQQHSWLQQGLDMTVAVNISAIDLIDMELPTLVSDLLSEFACEPGMLTLEVTESAIMSDPQSAIRALNTLKRMGIQLSIDDFGTGYSSMAQLKTMPVHELKIDKAFVLELAANQDDQTMVKSMVTLAANLNLNTVAEGVEDEPSLAFLRQIGCTKAQGFYLSKALPIAQFNQWLQVYRQKSEEEASA